jgi:tRNA-specific 2-thiouridylase
MNQTVYVGMSGGVDSSAAAALLKQSGYNVVGVFMKNWTKSFPGSPCTWQEDFEDAKRVAVQLGIDFKVFDFEKDYKHKVVDYMISEYQAGRTPNPDIVCNQEIKFKLFLESSLAAGADLIATGHYARTKDGQLLTAKNKDKDQTYFLYRVSEEALKKTIFPIGDFATKAEVRRLAQKFNLATADKKDSQGICFVGQVGIRDFLSEYVETEPGDIVDQSGQIIGQHSGAIYYTIGQRHGLDVGGGLPYYVTSKDMKNNIVYVTSDLQDTDLWHDQIILENTHWIKQLPQPNKKYQVRTRHRASLVGGTTTIKNSKVIILLDEPIRALAPGQSAVVYDGQVVLGGGVISRVASLQTYSSRQADAALVAKSAAAQ